MRKSLIFLLLLSLFFPGGICLSTASPKASQPQITIAYTTNTWGQIEPIHS